MELSMMHMEIQNDKNSPLLYFTRMCEETYCITLNG